MLTMAMFEDVGENKHNEWKVELSPERQTSMLNEPNYINEKSHGTITAGGTKICS